MSNLDQLIEKTEEDQRQRLSLSRSQKPRLVADPMTSVADLMGILRIFLNHKETTDLHSCIAPPRVLKLDWKTYPDGDWLVKLSSLAFDFSKVAQNTKVHGKKLREAILKMVNAGEIKNTTRHDMKTFVDTCDLMLRIGMSMYRQLKSDLHKRDLVLKRLDSTGQRRLKLVLDQFLLPSSYSGEEELENQSDDESQGMQEVKFGQENLAGGQLAMVPVSDQPSPRTPKPSPTEAMRMCENDSLDTSFFDSINQMEDSPVKENATTFAPKEVDSKRLSYEGASFRFTGEDLFREMDMDMGDEKDEKIQPGSSKDTKPQETQGSKAKKPQDGSSSKENKNVTKLSDDHLLREALQHVPTKAQVMKRPGAALKRPASASVEAKISGSSENKAVSCRKIWIHMF